MPVKLLVLRIWLSAIIILKSAYFDDQAKIIYETMFALFEWNEGFSVPASAYWSNLTHSKIHCTGQVDLTLNLSS